MPPCAPSPAHPAEASPRRPEAAGRSHPAALERQPAVLRRHLARAALALAVLAPAALPLSAQEGPRVAEWVPEVVRPHGFELSLQNFMQGTTHVGQTPSAVNWTDDSRWVYFRWLPAGEEWDANQELYRVPAGGGEPERIDDPMVADSLALTFAGGDLSPDRRYRATAWRGDLYLVDRQSMEIRRLTDTRDTKSNPRFSADGSTLFFTQSGQIHALELASGTVRQLTDIRSGNAPQQRDPEGLAAFLRDQQGELFEHIRRQRARTEEVRELAEMRREGEIQAVFTGRNGNPGGVTVNPQGSWVALSGSQPAQGTRRVGVPQWITDDGYTAFNEIRTKVGDGVGSNRVGLHQVGADSIAWLDVGAAVRGWAESAAPVGVPLPEQRDAVRDGDVGVQSVQFRGWNDAGTWGLLSAGSFDNKHRWFFTVEAGSGELHLLQHVADSAWVGGPCGGCAGWLPGQDRVYWVSEADRFAHLYSANADGSDLRQLTSGDWEVHSVQIPEQNDRFILRTNEGSPFEQHIYSMAFDGSDRTRLTEGTGRFVGTLSPDGRRMAIVHSTQTRPDELFLADATPGAAMARITTSPSGDFLAFPWIEAEIIHFEARDGARVPARIYRPSEMGVEANGGAVLFVHGAGYLQNVHEWWSQYYREWMFHHFLAAQGFTVLDVDYRASAGYGRDWRTGIYRHMGGKDLWDYVDGVDWLAENEGVDRGRIGIYGGSYGGFITLMALFTEPEVFQAGGALRSVTDWAHYNEGYTSNILNRPQDDPEAYQRSSPIYFAEGLQGHLLMGHPMYDTNVHFSDIVRLTQRLIELGKENWELSVYPTENHGMTDPTSWVDQYRRIYELFWRTLSAPGCTEGTGVCEVPAFR
jgi:dipeptidyl aminopeptidase/acylaminoacyl peptidase